MIVKKYKEIVILTNAQKGIGIIKTKKPDKKVLLKWLNLLVYVQMNH